MSASRGSIGRLAVLTVAIVLFVPLVWVVLVVPTLSALGVSTATMNRVGWFVALCVAVGVGYVLYRDLLGPRATAEGTDRAGENE
ncbi:MAG: hypothetical protein QXG03_13730 [Halalkalicoccus sp.]